MPEEKQEVESKDCFVVMAFGRDEEEHRWFKGWYQEVIKPAIEAEGFNPLVGFAENKSNAINDEIRTHLSYDAMVVVDLGGRKPEDPPNPNVMYELGMRHAMNLPLIMMAWKGQRLPFDIANQRVIMEGREAIDFATNRTLLREHIRNAAEGEFYKPMDAVGRTATLRSVSHDESSVLASLVEEVRALKGRIDSDSLNNDYSGTVRDSLPDHQLRDLRSYFKKLRAPKIVWDKFLAHKVIPPEMQQPLEYWYRVLNNTLGDEVCGDPELERAEDDGAYPE